jgi:hypothetical protein
MKRIGTETKLLSESHYRSPSTKSLPYQLTQKPTTRSIKVSFLEPLESLSKDSKRATVNTEPKTFCESKAAEIVRFMRDGWKLPVPELIISVTGGANSFKIPLARVHNVFQQGLVSIAITTGTNRFIYLNLY